MGGNFHDWLVVIFHNLTFKIQSLTSKHFWLESFVLAFGCGGGGQNGHEFNFQTFFVGKF